MDQKMDDMTDRDWIELSLGDIDKAPPMYHRHIEDPDDYKRLYHYGDGTSLPLIQYDPWRLDKRHEAILTALQQYRVNNLLDIGSRAGFLIHAAIIRGIVDTADGVELDTRYYNMCRAIPIAARWYNCRGEDYRPDRTYDGVVIADTLEHVPDPDALLQHVRLMLDGVLIVTVPVGRGPLTADEKATMQSWDRVEHVRRYHHGDVAIVAKGAGFRPVMMTAFECGGWEIEMSVYA